MFDVKEAGERMKEARKAAKVSREQVAVAVGVSRETVSRWETGKVSVDVKHWDAIGALLGCDFGKVYRGRDD